MKTTIVVEDGGMASLPDATAAVQTAPPVSESAPVDAGSAPTGVAASNGATDAGVPPSWLVDAITQAGGMNAPSSPEGVASNGVDAGAAPS